MNSKCLMLLIVGLALLILGPVTGWGLTVLGFTHTAANVTHFHPGSMQDLNAHLQQTTNDMYRSIWPIVIGAVSGALGLFLVLLSFILNFNRQPAQTTRQPQPRSTGTNVTAPSFSQPDNSRYMPKA